ncbi:hypothetical protein EL17_04670 [Anditalea andensis]|uniref:Uncharacterized protein n=1 Tax=Anditalea andensis TaxID=1048983 RepID=A0A074L3A0_9BACT|nr:hypothetical protein EL17_04670 [Anditalea andensis]
MTAFPTKIIISLFTDHKGIKESTISISLYVLNYLASIVGSKCLLASIIKTKAPPFGKASKLDFNNLYFI